MGVINREIGFKKKSRSRSRPFGLRSSYSFTHTSTMSSMFINRNAAETLDQIGRKHEFTTVQSSGPHFKIPNMAIAIVGGRLPQP